MSLLQTVFLESPLWLAGFSFVFCAAALLARRRLEGPARRWILIGALGLVVLFFAVQWLVVTSREDVLAAQEAFVGAIERNDRSRWESLVSDSFEDRQLSRRDAVTLVAGLLERMHVYDTRYQRRDVEVDGDLAAMFLAARATVSVEGGLGEMHWGSWRIGWQREGGAWKIVSLQPVMVDAVALHGMGDLRGYAR